MWLYISFINTHLQLFGWFNFSKSIECLLGNFLYFYVKISPFKFGPNILCTLNIYTYVSVVLALINSKFCPHNTSPCWNRKCDGTHVDKHSYCATPSVHTATPLGMLSGDVPCSAHSFMYCHRLAVYGTSLETFWYTLVFKFISFLLPLELTGLFFFRLTTETVNSIRMIFFVVWEFNSKMLFRWIKGFTNLRVIDKRASF
jgi:hypothetical protein